jgi:hypothetical protein
MGAWDLHIEWEPIGYPEAILTYEGVARRARHPDMDGAMRALERAEMRRFDQLAPKYVRTGRLLESLTEDGRNAIRAQHGERAQFGTRVQYARAAGHRGGDLLIWIDDKGIREYTEAILDEIVHGDA